MTRLRIGQPDELKLWRWQDVLGPAVTAVGLLVLIGIILSI